MAWAKKDLLGLEYLTKEEIELILETADKIRRDTINNNFIATPKYFGREPACNYCAYNSICPSLVLPKRSIL